ncbi:hypothetical protein Avbf_00800 [Armadillidium vulgare]|nr:hypothetical protein Avbf_00800 [Armadillidium vulgare]
MIIMIICPASFFRSFTRNVQALTANSTTPSDFPDSRDSYDHNDYMPSLIFLGVRGQRFFFLKFKKN